MARGLVVRGLAVPPSIILARATTDAALTALFGPSDFAVWPDNAAMMADLKAGAVDLSIIPTNVAATLAAQWLPLGLARVTVWGILHVMSVQDGIRGWPDLAGRRVAVPLRGNMPDTIFTALLARSGVASSSIDVHYMPSYITALEAMLAGTADAAVLPEPLASVAESQGARRVLDLQREWGRLIGGPGRYPQAGVVVPRSRWNGPERDVLGGAVDRAVQWLANEPEAAGALGARLLGFDAAVIARSLRRTTWMSLSGAVARKELESFYGVLAATSAALLPDGMPPDDFYLA